MVAVAAAILAVAYGIAWPFTEGLAPWSVTLSGATHGARPAR
jgi:hypothetical protein